jgi:hypothetical protein
LAGVCVDSEATTGGSASVEGSESASSSSGDSATACGEPCTTPPGPCFEPNGVCEQDTCVYAPIRSGMSCDDEDLCSASSTCDGEGSCIADIAVVCDLPPSDCHEPIGTCDPIDGECTYDVLDEGSPCEDGDACTEDDTCDGAGVCTPGALCPTDNPCETGTCVPGGCMYAPIPDGTSCGLRPADRCCAGTCIDIASDVANCGGCGVTCDPGYGCSSVVNTPDCNPAPADTSGRCTCDGNVNCDPGHVCRTQNPYTNLCTPETADACPGTFVDVDFCPNYCAY